MKAKKLPSGNWNCQVYLGMDSNGKKIVESVTAPTRKEAEYLAAERKLSAPTSSRMTLRQACLRYVENRKKVFSASTVREYTRAANSLPDRIMDMDISSINQEDVEQTVNDMAGRMAPKTVRNYYGIITAVLGAFRPNVRFKVKLPQKEKTDVYIPEEDTVRRLYDLLQDSWLLVPFLLASQCGLRASEIAGLQYKHIKNGEIHIRQARVRAIGGTAIKKPKSTAGEREIKASEVVLDSIGSGDPDEYIVGKSSITITNKWQKFMEQHPEEEYFSFHKLRHFFASRALLIGIPKRYVAYMMGHASEHMLDQIYEHVFSAAKDTFSAKLASENDTFFQ